MTTHTLSSASFGGLDLKQFASPGIGLVLEAPVSWVDSGTPQHFQVRDPETDTQFTASAFQNPGMALEQWTELRLTIVVQEMPGLKCVRQPYALRGSFGTGMASDYEGVFPGGAVQKHYLVLCAVTDSQVLSVTVTADTEVFNTQEALYRWLLETKLDLYAVKRAG